jgi:hypothetical protein
MLLDHPIRREFRRFVLNTYRRYVVFGTRGQAGIDQYTRWLESVFRQYRKLCHHTRRPNGDFNTALAIACGNDVLYLSERRRRAIRDPMVRNSALWDNFHAHMDDYAKRQWDGYWRTAA